MSQIYDNTTDLQTVLETVNSLPDAISVDSALSETSTNPVQNKIVTEALNGKSDIGHTHSASDITDGLATVATSGSYDDLSNKPTIPAAVTVDSALSSSSTNPVQNKVINSALAGKAASSHNQDASTITGGTFAGAVVAQTFTQTPSASLLRNSKLVTTETNPSNNGEICWTYE